MPTLDASRKPWVVGHRGAAGEACENTLRSFARALASGVDMIELDVQLASDGELVCFHDWTLERLAQRSEAVEEETSVFLQAIALDGDSGDADDNRIPLLAEALKAIPEPMPLNIELKRNRVARARLAHACVEAVAHRSDVLVSSFDWDLLAEVRKLAPRLALAPIARHHPDRLITAGRDLGAFSLHCHRRMAATGVVERAAAAGFERVLAYTVNDPQEAEALLSLGMDGIFTDQPTAMIEHLGALR